MTPFRLFLSEVRSRRPTDYLAIAITISLPWSTSAASILMVLWLVAFLPIADIAGIRRELLTLEGGVPVLLVVLAAFGMLWADVSWSERISGLREFQKLLFIPVVMAYFRRSDAGMRVVLSFLGSCIALLAVAIATVLWPELQWWQSWGPGVPVKNYITQSAEFTIAAFWLLYLAVDAWRAKARGFSIAAASVAFAFLGLILFVVTSRTELVIILIFLPIFAAKVFGRRGLLWCLIALPTLMVIAWSISDYLRARVGSTIAEIQSYQTHDAPTSTGFRLEFWRKSVAIIAEAPLAGHGTGSIRAQFEEAAVGRSGLAATVTSNPHNQVFAVAIQIGLIGVAALLAMWFAHFMIFLRRGLAAWFGLVIVIQTILGSLFNSHLFDFTEGWIYVLGVGALAGLIRCETQRAPLDRDSRASYLASLLARPQQGAGVLHS